MSNMVDDYILHSADELRKVLLDNPNLPMVIMADGDTSCADSDLYWVQSCIRVEIGIILACDIDWTDKYYTDDCEFQDDLRDYYYDSDLCSGMNDREFEDFVQGKLDEFDKYWKKVIIVYVSN